MQPKPGDIILYPVTPKSELTSRLVAAGELLLGAGKGEVQYSHAAILDIGGYQFEAKWPKTGRFLIDDSRPFEVWSVGDPSDAQRRRIRLWCLDNLGHWYNMLGLLTFGLLGLPHHEVCSQFAGLAYQAANIEIGKEGKRLLSPDAIADSPKAVLVQKFKPGQRSLV